MSIDLDINNTDQTLNFQVDEPFAAIPVGVEHAGGIDVSWSFHISCSSVFEDGVPSLDTGDGDEETQDTDGNTTSFKKNGITVTLPTGSPNPVGDDAGVTIEGPPAESGSFRFDLRAELADESKCEPKRYDVLIACPPMDVVLVLDRSGSMGTITDADVTRWEALKTAVSIFSNIYENLEKPDDRLSITYFATDLIETESDLFDEFQSVDSDLAENIEDDLDGRVPGGSTAMGLGMQDAQEKLSDSDGLKSIVLFTDGRQNQPPEVRTEGTGYEDSAPGENVFEGIKISTIGIGNPNGAYLDTIQNLATNNSGSYHISEDGEFSGDFMDALETMLSDCSPQLIDRTSTEIPGNGSSVTLQTFPLNNKVDKLLLNFVVNTGIKQSDIELFTERIQVLKNGTEITRYARLSMTENATNTMLLTIDFDKSVYLSEHEGQLPPLQSEGDWTVQLSDSSDQRINQVDLTSIADDHRLDIKKQFENRTPRVNESFPISVSVNWLGEPVEDASVEALILRPGEDLGDLLARNSLTVDVSDSSDAGLPGTQKYEELWKNNPKFREQLKKTENLLPLQHTSDGVYEGVFEGMDVSGVYRIVMNVSGDLPEAGSFKRTLSESVYTRFGGVVDLAESGVTADVVNGQQLVMNFRPITDYGRYIGPAMGDAFKISDPDVQIDDIEDHQDGSYTITFTGDIDKDVTLELLGQDIYTGRLQEAGQAEAGGGIDSITNWLESLGLPGWTIWLLLLLIILILWLVF